MAVATASGIPSRFGISGSQGVQHVRLVPARESIHPLRKLQRFLAVAQRILRTGGQQKGQVDLCLRVVGLVFEGLAEVGDGPAVVAPLDQRRPQDCDRQPEGRASVAAPRDSASWPRRIAPWRPERWHIVVQVRVVGRSFSRRPILFHGLLELAAGSQARAPDCCEHPSCRVGFPAPSDSVPKPRPSGPEEKGRCRG